LVFLQPQSTGQLMLLSSRSIDISKLAASANQNALSSSSLLAGDHPIGEAPLSDLYRIQERTTTWPSFLPVAAPLMPAVCIPGSVSLVNRSPFTVNGWPASFRGSFGSGML